MKNPAHLLPRVLALIVLLAPPALLAADAQKSGVSASDLKFVKKAAMGGMMEVQLGELAQKNAASPAVKEFGKMMVTDHEKANAELHALITRKELQLPSKLSKKHEATVQELTKLNGDVFDKAYVSDMVTDHEMDIAEFRTAAKDLTDPELKHFAQATLPVLEKHLQKIQEIQKSME